LFCCTFKVHGGPAPLFKTPLPQRGRFAFMGFRNSLSFLYLPFKSIKSSLITEVFAAILAQLVFLF
jgi:hypothetical protein